VLLTLAALLAVAALPPIPQPEQYHYFADQRALLGVPHALNVISSLGLLIVGAVALTHRSPMHANTGPIRCSS
jgi:hypothetical protein